MENQKPIREEILETIQNRGIKMRPRWQFILSAVLGIIGIILLLLLLLYITSFIIFGLRESGAWFGPAFGFRGWFILFRSLPWVLIALSIVFLIVLEILVRRYSFAYRKSLLYCILVVLIIIFIGGVFSAPFHRKAFTSSRERYLPVMGPFYDFGSIKGRDVYRGRIRQMFPNGFLMEGREGNSFHVIILPTTRLPYGADLNIGETVIVFGHPENGTILAYGLEEIEEK